jgi:hypothetical protein
MIGILSTLVVNLLTYALHDPSYRGARIVRASRKQTFDRVALATAISAARKYERPALSLVRFGAESVRCSAQKRNNGLRRSFGMAWELVMIDMDDELELLERCALECSLIAALAADRRTRTENEELASEYREIAEALRSYRRAA